MHTPPHFDRTALRIWLVSIVIGFGLTLFSYVAVQQALRLSLNDPQTQIAQDAAAQLQKGALPSTVIPASAVDESASLAPFITVVDAILRILATSGHIGKIVPLPPASAFLDSQKRKTNWFTWQHDNNTVRDAAVIVPYGGPHPGYVLAARSMKQVENIIGHITVLAALTLAGILIGPLIVLRLTR